MMHRYNISDKKLQALCAAACDAKGIIWNAFFGWRRTWYDNEVEVMEFLLPSYLWERLIDDYKYYFGDSPNS